MTDPRFVGASFVAVTATAYHSPMDKTPRPELQIRVAPAARQRRWTVFFRQFMVLPHSFVLAFLLFCR